MSGQKPCISIFGLGYVGTVMAACLAEQGHAVIGVDVNSAKVEMLESGGSPIIEAQIEELIAKARRASRLHATTDAARAVCESDISFVCVGTPSHQNGKVNLSYIEHACREIGEGLGQKAAHHLVVIRSTVMPGTTASVVVPILEAAGGKRAGSDFSVCYNPEFLREGTAVSDFFHPPYTLLGARDPDHVLPLRQLYSWLPGGFFETTFEVAEMVKYVSNWFHALKVSFANEMGALCEELGVDSKAVTDIFTFDTKLNMSKAYLLPGFAFGGPCLPKDVRALTHRARELGLRLSLLNSILPSNREHLQRAVDAVLQTNKKKVGVLGLSFKAGTDDLRESPQVELIQRLLGEGCQIRIWDQQVSLKRLLGSNQQYVEEVIPHIDSLLVGSFEQVLESAEVVVVATKFLPKEELWARLRPEQIVIDLVNLEKPRLVGGVASYQKIC